MDKSSLAQLVGSFAEHKVMSAGHYLNPLSFPPTGLVSPQSWQAAEKLLRHARTSMIRSCACDELSRAAQQEYTPAK